MVVNQLSKHIATPPRGVQVPLMQYFEEARSSSGMKCGSTDAAAVVDIGGGSTEVACGRLLSFSALE